MAALLPRLTELSAFQQHSTPTPATGYNYEGQVMRNLILALVMCVGCAPVTDSPSIEGAAGALAPAPLLEGPTYDMAVDSGTPPPMAVDPELELEGMTPEQLNELWFGDPDTAKWGCCWTDACDQLAMHFCDDEVPATDGLHTCCVPDIGQCPESMRPDDADAGM